MKIIKPKLSKGHSLIDVKSLFQTDERSKSFTVHDQQVQLKASDLNIADALLEKIDFAGSRLEKLEANDVIFRTCNLSSVVFSQGFLNRVEFMDNRMTGVNAAEASLKNVAFYNCKLDVSNFRFSKLTNVLFDGCLLNDADFQGVEFKNVMFHKCIIERTQFSQCRMGNVDMRGSHLSQIGGLADLKGVVLDDIQLMALGPELAAGLGIIIKNE